jgi:hypothetical protein
MVMHPLKKFFGDWITRCRANDRIDRASGAYCSLTTVDPFDNVGWWEHGQAIEAAAYGAFFYFTSV